MYSIVELELVGFTGMWLNNINKFKMKVVSKYLLILGRNGSGKSRLISQLNPLAPAKTDFHVDGHKRIVIELNSEQFELTFKRTKSAIKCTIQNLNTGELLIENANPSVSNQMVKELFSYDKEVHDILTGRVLFTEMRTPDRRKWFSMLSESDLTYALNFYKRAKENHRDLSGSIKSTKYSIGTLRPKVLESDEERLATKARIDTLQSDITKIDREIESADASPDSTMLNYEQNELLIRRIDSEILKTDIYTPTEIEGLDIRQLEDDVIHVKATRNGYLSKQEDLIKRIERAKKMTNVDTTGMAEQSQAYTDAIEELATSIVTFENLKECSEADIRVAANQYEEYKDGIIEALTLLDCGLPVDNLRGRHETLVKEGSELQKRVNELTNAQNLKVDRMRNIERMHEVECENCNHIFKPGVGKNEEGAINQELVQLSTDIKEAQKALDSNLELTNRYGKLLDVMGKLNDMVRYFGNTAANKVLFDSLIQGKAFSVNQQLYIPFVKRFGEELEIALRRAEMVQLKERVDTDLRIHLATQTEDVEGLAQEVGAVEKLIAGASDKIKHTEEMLDLIKKTKITQQRLDELEGERARAMQERDRLEHHLIENVRVDVLSEHRAHLWELLIVAKQRFEDMERERVKLETMEQQLVDLETRFEHSRHVVKSMSPDGGILAKYLYQCITQITDMMSAYVNQIWGYEMKILPCDVSDTELDYKFPFWAKDSSNTSPDVSLGSKAQKEVINFVFMLAVYRAMKLECYPLFLDELGSGFDEGHKPTMITFIKSLIERAQHSQVWMVSHDAATHYQLTHADVVVLDANGVTLPKKYNEYVEIS